MRKKMNHFFQSSLVNLSMTQRGNSEACLFNKGSVLTTSGTNYTEAWSGQDDHPLDVPLQSSDDIVHKTISPRVTFTETFSSSALRQDNLKPRKK